MYGNKYLLSLKKHTYCSNYRNVINIDADSKKEEESYTIEKQTILSQVFLVTLKNVYNLLKPKRMGQGRVEKEVYKFVWRDSASYHREAWQGDLNMRLPQNVLQNALSNQLLTLPPREKVLAIFF